MNVLKRLWAQEPVIVASIVPLLAITGVLTTTQASALAKTIGGVVSAVVTLVAAFTARAKVSPGPAAPAAKPQGDAGFASPGWLTVLVGVLVVLGILWLLGVHFHVN